MKQGEAMQYRPCVGIMLADSKARVLVAKRTDMDVDSWQMPQGGINNRESPEAAAWREMREELGTNKAIIIAESKNWYSYELPSTIRSKIWRGKYKGQRQKWFLFKFLGSDCDIDLYSHGNEFSEWKWVEPDQLAKLIVKFKQKVYTSVVSEFTDTLAQFRDKTEL